MDQAETDEGELCGVEEAIDAYSALLDRDRTSLARLARFFAGRGNLASAEELLSEAYVRIASGQRRWRKGRDFPHFLAGVIKSLASDAMFTTDARKVQNLDAGYSVVGQEDLPTVRDASDGTAVAQKMMVEQMWAHMEVHFANDEEMQLLVMGIQDQLRGQGLEAAVGVDAKRLAALRTRFNRELDKYIAALSAEEGQSHD